MFKLYYFLSTTQHGARYKGKIRYIKNSTIVGLSGEVYYLYYSAYFYNFIRGVTEVADYSYLKVSDPNHMREHM